MTPPLIRPTLVRPAAAVAVLEYMGHGNTLPEQQRQNIFAKIYYLAKVAKKNRILVCSLCTLAVLWK